MGCEQVMQRITFVAYGENMRRVRVSKDEDGEMVITVDLHRMKKEDAKKLINGIIALNRFEFRLDVIHGFNNGTVLKSMVNKELNNRRIAARYCDAWNPGNTHLIIV